MSQLCQLLPLSRSGSHLRACRRGIYFIEIDRLEPFLLFVPLPDEHSSRARHDRGKMFNPSDCRRASPATNRRSYDEQERSRRRGSDMVINQVTDAAPGADPKLVRATTDLFRLSVQLCGLSKMSSFIRVTDLVRNRVGGVQCLPACLSLSPSGKPRSPLHGETTLSKSAICHLNKKSPKDSPLTQQSYVRARS